MMNKVCLALLVAGSISSLQAQGSAMNGNMAWQMQQQQMQAQRMFQMQRQMQRNLQIQQQMSFQQRQLQQQMTAQTATQRMQREAALELAQRKAGATAPSMPPEPKREVWRTSLEEPCTMPVFDGLRMVCRLNSGHNFQVLDANSGKRLWELELKEAPILDPMFVGDDLVYGASGMELVVLEAQTGKVRRRLKLDEVGSYVLSNRSAHTKMLFPAIEGQTMVLGTFGKGPSGPTGWIYAVDLASWSIQWKHEFQGGPDLSPRIQGDRVIVGGAGRLLALGIRDGNPIWTTAVATDVEMKDGPLLGDCLVCVCDKNLVAADLKNGQVRWRYPCSNWSVPIGENDRIIFTEDRGLIFSEQWMVGIDTASGKAVWELQVGATSLPWIQNGKVCCSAKETLLALDLATGKQSWSRPMTSNPVAPITVSGEALYTVHKDGRKSRLTAIQVKDGKPIWEHVFAQKAGSGFLYTTEKGFLICGSDPDYMLLE